jgi:hypothetical protein
MTEAEHDTMEVLVIVAMPQVQTNVSEMAWEKDILDAVSAAVHADKTLDTLEVRPLEYEDCEWVFEGGMPLPNYGVTVFQNGSWHSGVELFRGEYETTGQNLQSLFDYLIEKGLVKK